MWRHRLLLGSISTSAKRAVPLFRRSMTFKSLILINRTGTQALFRPSLALFLAMSRLKCGQRARTLREQKRV